jgi:hypothetical protein
MEIIFPINIENYQQMKLAIEQYRGAESAGKMIKFAQAGKFFRKLPRLEKQQNTSLRLNVPKISPSARLRTRVDSAPLEQYLIQSPLHTSSVANEINPKKMNLINKTASAPIRLTMKNLIIIIIFLERAKLLRLIDNDPCLYNRDSKFKSTKESLDVLSRDFISSDTNLLRRLKSLDEFNYLISNNENKLFEELKDGIRLTRCTQILLSSNNEHVARFDLSTKLKCPVVNLVHKLLSIDQAFELLQTYGHILI